ncbi:MAG: cell wall hydrolase [Butyrivibrio sp.]|nr:cell wall hydrolase [Butyrivibrio sp.]
MNRAMKLSAEVLRHISIFALIFVLFISQRVTTEARSSSPSVVLNSEGISKVVSPITPLGLDYNSPEYKVLANQREASSGAGTASTSSNDENKLVMFNENETLDVMDSYKEDGEKVGVLYKDCGGKILERKDGWTKLQSGDLIGWAEDKYLLFDEEANELASKVGKQIVTIESSALTVRASDSTDADAIVVMNKNAFLDMIEDLGNGWIKVDYNDKECFVQSDYVCTDFRIDQGETIASRKLKQGRSRANSEELTRNRGAVQADADELKLLAALIQCEAGNQPYEGRVAVGAVVMNRVKSGAYPNTIYDVIYASGQFTPALNGTVDRVYNSDKIYEMNYQAAQAALNGETTVGSAMHFRRINGHEGIIIGAHVFW